MFSIGFKSGEFRGQTSKVSFTNASEWRNCVVAFAAWEGTLSCMNIIFFNDDNGRLSSQGSRDSFKNGQYVAEDNLRPSGTRKGPMISNDSTQNYYPSTTLLTPHPVTTMATVENPFLAQPSGPSSDALDSSVKRTNCMSVFIYFLDHSIRKRLYLGVKNGLLITPSIRFRVVFRTSGRLGSFNILAIVAPGILRVGFFSHDSYLAQTPKF